MSAYWPDRWVIWPHESRRGPPLSGFDAHQSWDRNRRVCTQRCERRNRCRQTRRRAYSVSCPRRRTVTKIIYSRCSTLLGRVAFEHLSALHFWTVAIPPKSAGGIAARDGTSNNSVPAASHRRRPLLRDGSRSTLTASNAYTHSRAAKHRFTRRTPALVSLSHTRGESDESFTNGHSRRRQSAGPVQDGDAIGP